MRRSAASQNPVDTTGRGSGFGKKYENPTGEPALENRIGTPRVKWNLPNVQHAPPAQSLHVRGTHHELASLPHPSSFRRLRSSCVQCNYGGSQQLRVAGIAVAREMNLQRPCVAKPLNPPVLGFDGKPAPVCDPKLAGSADGVRAPEEGSIIVIVATDAPLTPDQLKRLARRGSVGLGRVGAIEGDESGDIFLAFSTANAGVDEGNSAQPPFVGPNATIQRLQSWKMDPMFPPRCRLPRSPLSTRSSQQRR